MPSDLGDLAVLEPLDVVQHERRAASVGQLRHRALEIHLRHRLLRQAAAARLVPARLVVERVGELARARRPAPQVVEAQIRRQPIQPRAERRLAAKAVELPVRREKNLLQQVLGVGRVAEHAAGDAVEPSGVGPVELLERRQVPLPAAFDERHVLGPARRGRQARRGGLDCYLRRSHAASALPLDSPVSRSLGAGPFRARRSLGGPLGVAFVARTPIGHRRSRKSRIRASG